MTNATDQHQTGTLAAWVSARDQNRADQAPPAPPATPVPRGADHLAAEAIAKAAQKSLRMPVYVESARIAARSLAEIGELLPERALLAVLQSDADSVGVLALCPATVASLLEMQTLGRVTARSVAHRRPTRTDATLCADFINRSLGELSAALHDHADTTSFAGYRYASHMDDPRPLLLLLDDRSYQVLQLTLRYGEGGQRDGQIIIAIPVLPSGARAGMSATGTLSALPPGLPGPAPARQAGTGTGAGAAGLRESLRAAPVQLQAMLARRRIKLGDLRRLKPGDCIPLPHQAISNVRLESRAGQLLALGSLGEAEGFHALRLRPADNVEAGTGADQPAFPTAQAASQPDLPGDIASADPPPDEWPEPPIEDLENPDQFRPDIAAEPMDPPEEEDDMMPMTMQIT